MTDETLQQRVVRLGVKPEQVDDAVKHLEANAVSSHFHKFADDAEVARSWRSSQARARVTCYSPTPSRRGLEAWRKTSTRCNRSAR